MKRNDNAAFATFSTILTILVVCVGTFAQPAYANRHAYTLVEVIHETSPSIKCSVKANSKPFCA